jgi:flagellar FliL protein
MSKTVLIVVAVGVLLLGGMGAGFYVLWSKISSMEASAQAASSDSDPSVPEDFVRPVYHLDTLIVNLADQGGRRYLRMTLDVELEDTEYEMKITERLPQVKDAILKIASTRRFEDISTIAGKNELRDETVARLNEILKKDCVTNLYFTEFVVQ